MFMHEKGNGKGGFTRWTWITGEELNDVVVVEGRVRFSDYEVWVYGGGNKKCRLRKGQN